ncbi:RusA family crossover junction endodeoxyribonuclease [Shewanella sp.]|jgi:Holliday junction resolvase RusA-like endonuclease|uniref:RusA family crossover junction endodeoxyribonuclease n=1 Tax=Shewanella sp. TaxID=50422 RepID=UPI003567B642
MKTIEAIIYVVPTPKGRARVAVIGGHARAYTPAKTRKAENDISYAIRQQCMGQGTFDAGVPLTLYAKFFIDKPKSAPKKMTAPVHRPDLDNYVKLLLDALNKFVIPDDSQVVNMHIKKCFGSPPRIELIITEGLE